MTRRFLLQFSPLLLAPIGVASSPICEYDRCKNDIVYFAEKYVQINSLRSELNLIKLYPRQKEILRSWETHTHNSTISCRQFGTTTLSCIFALHKALFSNTPVNIVLVCNRHEQVQHMQEMATKMFASNDNIVKNSQGMIELHNGSKLLFYICNDSEIYGRTHNPPDYVIVDQPDYIISKHTFSKVLSMFMGSTIIMCGTPKEYGSILINNNFHKEKVTWKDVPHWDNGWAEDMRRNLRDDKIWNLEFELS